jgi:hypothetical protein
VNELIVNIEHESVESLGLATIDLLVLGALSFVRSDRPSFVRQ